MVPKEAQQHQGRQAHGLSQHHDDGALADRPRVAQHGKQHQRGQRSRRVAQRDADGPLRKAVRAPSVGNGIGKQRRQGRVGDAVAQAPGRQGRRQEPVAFPVAGGGGHGRGHKAQAGGETQERVAADSSRGGIRHPPGGKGRQQLAHALGGRQVADALGVVVPQQKHHGRQHALTPQGASRKGQRRVQQRQTHVAGGGGFFGWWCRCFRR